MTTPKYGSTRMYTSGWPKNQNRCCHRIGHAAAGDRRRRCGRRSGGRRTACTPAAVSTGNAISTSTLVTSMFHVKIGMRNIVMPGARMRDDGGDDVDRGEHARQAGEHDADDPQVAADARASGRRPTAARRRSSRSRPRRSTVRKPDEHREAAEQVEPVRERVEARERHVAGADLQRHEVVRQAEGERPEEQEQHDAAVHREELVVACWCRPAVCSG